MTDPDLSSCWTGTFCADLAIKESAFVCQWQRRFLVFAGGAWYNSHNEMIVLEGERR